SDAVARTSPPPTPPPIPRPTAYSPTTNNMTTKVSTRGPCRECCEARFGATSVVNTGQARSNTTMGPKSINNIRKASLSSQSSGSPKKRYLILTAMAPKLLAAYPCEPEGAGGNDRKRRRYAFMDVIYIPSIGSQGL